MTVSIGLYLHSVHFSDVSSGHGDRLYVFQTLAAVMTVSIGLCLVFRPASLYHPQRLEMKDLKIYFHGIDR